jgi:L-2,4-diaminobutyrate decarboxylase
MGVPIPNSLLFLQNGADFKRMAIFSDYFNRPGESKPNPGLKSPPSTRPLAALPLVASIRHQGLDHLRQRLRAPLETVRQAAAYIDSQPDLELMLQPDLGIFCVRLLPPGIPGDHLDALQKILYDKMLAEARRSVSFTRINGQDALRFLILTPEQTVAEIIKTLDYLRVLAADFNRPLELQKPM